MNGTDDQKVRDLLKGALPPWTDADLKHDLWPRMLQKFDERAYRVAWFEWALILLAGTLLVFFPEVIPALLYHL